jgi:hypothetical protein
MNDDLDKLLGDDVFAPALTSEAKARSLVLYEEKVVKKILAAGGLPQIGRDIADLVKDRTGKAKVTLGVFYEFYPNFPIKLVIKRIPYVYTVTVSDMFNSLKAIQVFTTWEELFDELGDEDKPFGIIFDWPGVKGTQMVVHNMSDVNLDLNDVRVVRRIGKGADAQTLYLERFQPFMDTVIDRWVR